MPRVNPAETVVTSVEVGGGKAVVECKGDTVTYTLELRDSSGLLPYLYEGAKVSFGVDLQSPAQGVRGEITNSQSLSSASKPSEPEFTAVKADGFANVGIDQVKDLFGIPGGTSAGPAPTTGVITPTH